MTFRVVLNALGFEAMNFNLWEFLFKDDKIYQFFFLKISPNFFLMVLFLATPQAPTLHCHLCSRPNIS